MQNSFEFIDGGTITSPRGFQAGGIHSGIKKNGSLDLSILSSEADCVCDGVFTRNKMKSAHVLLDQERLPSCSMRALVASSGCANAGTGKQGISNALSMMAAAAKRIGIDEDGIVAPAPVLSASNYPSNALLRL